MRDNYEYEDDIFEEDAVDNSKEKNGKGLDKNKLLIIAIVAAVVVVIVVGSLLLGSGSDKKKEDDSLINEDSVSVENASAEDAITPEKEEQLYKIGEYTVNVGGSAKLSLRQDASSKGEFILAIPNKTKLEITEVFYNSAEADGLQYWGKTSYLGYDAWVCMSYLEYAYTGSISTPGEVPEDPTEPPTVKPADPPTEPSGGDENVYTVSTDLNMRAEPTTDSDKVGQIPEGTKVTVLETRNNDTAVDETVKVWAKVTYGDKTGWVAMWYLKK